MRVCMCTENIAQWDGGEVLQHKGKLIAVYRHTKHALVILQGPISSITQTACMLRYFKTSHMQSIL